jgi:ABC-type transporter Mla subunit MlaD
MTDPISHADDIIALTNRLVAVTAERDALNDSVGHFETLARSVAAERDELRTAVGHVAALTRLARHVCAMAAAEQAKPASAAIVDYADHKAAAYQLAHDWQDATHGKRS